MALTLVVEMCSEYHAEAIATVEQRVAPVGEYFGAQPLCGLVPTNAC